MAACLDHCFAPGEKVGQEQPHFNTLSDGLGKALRVPWSQPVYIIFKCRYAVWSSTLYTCFVSSVSGLVGSSGLILTMLFLTESVRSSYLAVWLAVSKIVHRIHLYQSPPSVTANLFDHFESREFHKRLNIETQLSAFFDIENQSPPRDNDEYWRIHTQGQKKRKRLDMRQVILSPHDTDPCSDSAW